MNQYNASIRKYYYNASFSSTYIVCLFLFFTNSLLKGIKKEKSTLFSYFYSLILVDNKIWKTHSRETQKKKQLDMVQPLRVDEMRVQFPAPTWRHTTICKSSSKDPAPSSGLLGHNARHTCRQNNHTYNKNDLDTEPQHLGG